MKKQYILQTDRLLLRCYEKKDAEVYHSIVTQPKIYANTINIPKNYPLEHARFWIDNMIEHFECGQGYEFGIFLKENGQYIGNCALISIAYAHRRAEISYFLGSQFEGNGYMSEAVRALCDFGFNTLNLNKITGKCLTSNLASKAVMTKNGFIVEGDNKQDMLKDGVFMDTILLGLLRNEWNRDYKGLQ